MESWQLKTKKSKCSHTQWQHNTQWQQFDFFICLLSISSLVHKIFLFFGLRVRDGVVDCQDASDEKKKKQVNNKEIEDSRDADTSTEDAEGVVGMSSFPHLQLQPNTRSMVTSSSTADEDASFAPSTFPINLQTQDQEENIIITMEEIKQKNYSNL